MGKFQISKLLNKIPDPDEFVVNKIKNMPKNVKIALISSVIFSILVHGFFFWSKFVNEDGIFGIRRSSFYMYNLGRWFVGYVLALRGDYVIPWIIGIFAIAYLVISICLIVYMLEIKSKIFVVITSFLMVSFPTLAYWFGYDHASDKLTAAILIATIAVFIAKKYKHGYLPGAFVLMLSLATYQASLGIAAGLVLIIMIKYVLNESSNVKIIIQNLARYIAFGVLGVIAYLISVRISLYVTNSLLRDHAGIDTMGQIPLAALPELIIQSFLDFFMFFWQTNRFFYVSNIMAGLYIAMFLLISYFLIYIVIAKKLYKQPAKITILILLLISLPMGLNSMGILAPERRVGTLNIYQFVLFIVFIFLLFEIYRTLKQDKKKAHLSKWAVTAVTFLIACNFLLISGLYYFRLHIFYERTFAFYNRVLSRIEATEGFRGDLPLAIFGRYPPFVTFQPSSEQFPELLNSQGVWGQFVGVNSNQPVKARNFIDHYLGVHFNLASEQEMHKIRSRDDFVEMPAWPQQGSVAVIDGIIVVKLAATPASLVIEQIYGSLHRISGHHHRLPDDYLYAWYIYRGTERIEVIWYTPGLSSIEFEFTEHARYSFVMFVRTADDEFFLPAVHGGPFIFRP